MDDVLRFLCSRDCLVGGRTVCADVGLEVLKQLGHGILSKDDQMLF